RFEQHRAVPGVEIGARRVRESHPVPGEGLPDQVAVRAGAVSPAVNRGGPGACGGDQVGHRAAGVAGPAAGVDVDVARVQLVYLQDHVYGSLGGVEHSRHAHESRWEHGAMAPTSAAPRRRAPLIVLIAVLAIAALVAGALLWRDRAGDGQD